MPNDQIHCPHCNELISIDQVLSHQIEDTLRREFAEKQKKQEAAILQKQKQQEEELKRKQEELDKQAAKQKQAVEEVAEEIARRQDEIKRQQAEILRQKEQSEEEIETKVAQQIQTEKANLMKTAREQARVEAEKEQNEKTSHLEEQLRAKDEKIKAATTREIEFMKEKSKLREEKDQFELEKMRQLEEAKKQIQEEAKKQATEEQHYVIAQMQKKLDDATKAKDELARKLEQGSQQTQGEVLELELESLLMTEYPQDQIEPVPKGVFGADIIQKVKNRNGSVCGTIVWESKKTKNWTEGWVQKLKDDLRGIKADIAVLVSTALPQGMSGFGLYNGIWVCEVKYATALSYILRHNLESLHRERALSVGKNEKMEILYTYLTGNEFRQRVEAIMEAFSSMKDDLSKERMMFERSWAKREKQIMKIMQNTVGMHGELSGMVTMQSIKSLEIGDDDVEVVELPEKTTTHNEKKSVKQDEEEDTQSTLL